jgi:hypothetical protein
MEITTNVGMGGIIDVSETETIEDRIVRSVPETVVEGGLSSSSVSQKGGPRSSLPSLRPSS